MKLIDLTGKRFGRLIVIRRSYPNAKNKDVKWLCGCDCGTKKVVRGKNLKQGCSKSCGCLKGGNNKLILGLASLRQALRSYKQIARKRECKWDLTEEQFAELTQQDCYYCGAKPANIFNQKGSNGEYIYNGLDRVDNSKGYTMDNVVPCCKICNIAKNNMTLKSFKDWIKRIYNKIIKEEK